MKDEDLRAAVQAGIVSEAQAASLHSLVQQRSGYKSALPSEDEPFEFFRGFAEIFITIGLVIFLSGFIGVATLIGAASSSAPLTMVLTGVAAFSWVAASYFTRRRRMTLPSMLLTLSFAISVCALVLNLLADREALLFGVDRTIVLLPLGVTTLALAGWFYRFKLPFAMFVLGLSFLMTLYAVVATDNVIQNVIALSNDQLSMFDLRQSPAFSLCTLFFGIGAFALGMWFDMKDPHRLGRHSSTAFWLHLLAAGALVNTVALTLYNSEMRYAMLALCFALFVITILALVVDRRSFLSAAIAYFALVLAWAIGDQGSVGSWTLMLLILGAMITATGTWWVPLRSYVMRILPDFPGKSRLPPYSRPE